VSAARAVASGAMELEQLWPSSHGGGRLMPRSSPRTGVRRGRGGGGVAPPPDDDDDGAGGGSIEASRPAAAANPCARGSGSGGV
jgi:hypothetical protein